MCGDDLVFWSGNDSDTVPMMALGAMGVISVASNIIPADVAKLCELCLDGRLQGRRRRSISAWPTSSTSSSSRPTPSPSRPP